MACAVVDHIDAVIPLLLVDMASAMWNGKARVAEEAEAQKHMSIPHLVPAKIGSVCVHRLNGPAY